MFLLTFFIGSVLLAELLVLRGGKVGGCEAKIPSLGSRESCLACARELTGGC